MQKPVTFHLERFEGPLDLLLHLLSKNRIDIRDIPIAEILEQYLDYLNRMRALDIEVTGEFIAMAAQLIYIKSRMLLPVYAEEATEDPRTELIETLLDYQRVKQAGGMLLDRYALGRDVFTRSRETGSEAADVQYRHTAEQLRRAVCAILERAGRRLPPPKEAFDGVLSGPGVTVEEKITDLLHRFRTCRRLDFDRLVLESRDRSEIVAVFLAVLELSRTRKLCIETKDDQYTLVLAGDEDGEGQR